MKRLGQRAGLSGGRAIAGVSALMGMAIVLTGSCSAQQVEGGETHWLGICDADAQCGSGRCVCGLCSLGCNGDAACRAVGTGAQCFDVRSPGLAGRCAPGASVEPGVCLRTCTGGADCQAGSTCLAGACVRDATNVADSGADGGAMSKTDASGTGGANGVPDAGTGGATRDASPQRPDPSAFADVNVPIDFTDPVSLPPPATKFVGDASALLGVWIERTQDGQPCTPSHFSAASSFGGVCPHIEIRRDGAGGFVGVVYRNRYGGYMGLGGPYAPATDPDVGYPTGVSPDEYYGLRNPVAETKYRLLDPKFSGGTLTFWYAPMDLWSDWCALQTPHEWNTSDGHVRYRCIPQGIDAASFDPGKRVLCGDAGDGPMCSTTSNGSTVTLPCTCLTSDAAPLDQKSCGAAYCECSRSACHASLRSSSLNASLALKDDGTLVGSLQQALYSGGSPPFVFTRVSP